VTNTCRAHEAKIIEKMQQRLSFLEQLLTGSHNIDENFVITWSSQPYILNLKENESVILLRWEPEIKI
jgi:hypothetical protein